MSKNDGESPLVLREFWQRASEAQSLSADIAELAVLSKDSNSYVRSLVAGNTKSNIEILTNLSTDENEEVRIEVAKNPICNGEIMAKLSKDESVEVRREVAKNINTTPEILEFLSKDESESVSQYPWELVRSAVAANLKTTANVLEFLSKDSNSYVRSVVGSNPNTNQETLGVLSADEDTDVRRGVAGNPNTNSILLNHLSRDSVRSIVATNPQSNLEILEILSNDEDVNVRRNVARNPHTSLGILERLSRDDDVEVRCEVARNPNTSSLILEILSKDGDATVRRYIAEDEKAKPDSLMNLTQDPDYFIRYQVAQNPQANIKILEILSRDDNAQVRSKVAAHPRTSFEILQGLSRDQNPSVRSEVARNLNTPQETLRELALDASAEQGYRKVKSFVASNLNTNPETLEFLSKDEDTEVRCKVVENPSTSLEIIELLAKDVDAEVRRSVAENPRTSMEILAVLSKEIVEIGEEVESENVQELFRKAISFIEKGKGQFGADILFELASDGDLRSTAELVNIFMDQEDFGVVEELLDDCLDQEDSTVLYLRANLLERTGAYDFNAYLRAAHAGNPSAALALVEHFASSDVYLAKRWLARAKEIGHPKIAYFHDMLTIKPREKKFLINIETDITNSYSEVRVFDAKGIELVSTFEDLHEAVLFCLSKEGGFDVVHVNENGDAHYSYFGSHMKVINTYELIIAADSEYWFGRLEDMQDAIEEVEGTFGNWDLVIYDSIPNSSETASQSPVEWFPIEDEDEDEDQDEDEDEVGSDFVNLSPENFHKAGFFKVESGRTYVGDPGDIEEYLIRSSEENDVWTAHEGLNIFDFGTLASTSERTGIVYVEENDEGRIVKALISFDGEFEDELSTEDFVVGNWLFVGSGQLMVGDPKFLEHWKTNNGEEWNLEGKIGNFSYQGASATTIAHSFGVLADGESVVFSTGYGDGNYYVFFQIKNQSGDTLGFSELQEAGYTGWLNGFATGVPPGCEISKVVIDFITEVE